MAIYGHMMKYHIPIIPPKLSPTLNIQKRRVFKATRDSSDAAVSRARIHEKHQKKRRKERTQRGAKLDGEGAPGTGLERAPFLGPKRSTFVRKIG
jgi:hypothetical protein